MITCDKKESIDNSISSMELLAQRYRAINFRQPCVSLSDMCAESTAIIHMQYYTGPYNEYYIKELAILHINEIDAKVFKFSPPYRIYSADKARYDEQMTKRNLLEWNSGIYAYQYIGYILSNYMDYNIIVKNATQMHILGQYFNGDGRISVAQLPPITNKYRNRARTNCPYHGRNTVDNCAKRMVYMLLYEIQIRGTVIPLPTESD